MLSESERLRVEEEQREPRNGQYAHDCRVQVRSHYLCQIQAVLENCERTGNRVEAFVVENGVALQLATDDVIVGNIRTNVRTQNHTQNTQTGAPLTVQWAVHSPIGEEHAEKRRHHWLWTEHDRCERDPCGWVHVLWIVCIVVVLVGAVQHVFRVCQLSLVLHVLEYNF